MTSPSIITRLSDPATAVTDTACAADVYTVAPGYHVSFLAGAAADAGTPFDLIAVVAAHRGGPAAQRHDGTTWFHVLEGHLEIVELQDDRLRPSIRLSPGQTHTVAAGVPHIARNAGEGAVRFLIGGRPGTIASYLDQFDGLRHAYGPIA
ncbi:MAG TPA: cupin domain-containing protein [Solirubrobacteraceae bacterium]|nr:cupin domain-containing protein [Solirubrobacteraceae bacterium]